MADHSQKEQSGQMDTAPGSTTDSLGMASASSPASTFTAASFVGQQPTRITVILGNGESFIIPFDTKRLVHDLHGEAVRRANALGFHCTVDNSVLRLKDHDGPMVYTGDSVCEILTFGDPTLFFGPLNRTDADEATVSTLPGRQPHIPYSSDRPSKRQKFSGFADESQLSETASYIRWITPERALDFADLQSIPVDVNMISSTTTISDLHEIAFERLYPTKASKSGVPQPATVPELFLEQCHLSTDTSIPVTIQDLGLHGTLSVPINIFVVLRSAKDLSEVQDGPHKAWWFETSNRGIATFCTSLRKLCTQISNKSLLLNNVLQFIWEITHFPPAVIAFRQLYEGGYERGSNPEPLPFAVFAACLREAAIKIAPPWIAPTPHTALEASRQIFAWIYSNVLIDATTPILKMKMKPIVHKFHLKIVPPSPSVNTMTPFDNDEIVIIKGPTSEAITGVSSSGPTPNKVLVSKERHDAVSSKFLATATIGDYQPLHNFYFGLPMLDQNLVNHKRTNLPLMNDFDQLLLETNKLDAYKMIGPLRLTSCQPPMIALDQDGYVSVYDVFDQGCGERYPLIWNAINGNVKLNNADPGHMLLQKLQPVIAARKSEGFWEVDAWDEDGNVGDSRPPEEAIIVCVDRSSSMSSPMPSSWHLEESMSDAMDDNELMRLSEVKEIFQNLVARIAAYKLSTHMGLIAFHNRAKILQDLSPVLYDFKDRLMSTTPKRKTALWDAIELGREMLLAYKEEYPQVRCRIITLTDGQDNASSHSPWMISDNLCEDDIVMDAIVIGTDTTDDIFKVAQNSGGYAFLPRSRSALFQIFLLETFIDITIRPDIVKAPLPPALPDQDRESEFAAIAVKEPDMASSFDIPPCRPHPNEGDMFFALNDAGRYFANMSSRASEAGTSVTGLSGLTLNSGRRPLGGPALLISPSRRTILNEIRYIIDNNHDFIDVYVSETNMGVWKAVMRGPPESAYEAGTFVLIVDIDENFPRKPPTCRFITPILHPNITKHGRICHPIFDREWDTNFRVYDVLIQIYGILMSLEVRDAVDPLFTLKFWTDHEAGKKEVAAYIAKFATKSREVHRVEIAGAPGSSITTSSSARSSGVMVPSLTKVAASQSDAGTVTPSDLGSSFTLLSGSSSARSRRQDLRTSRHDFFTMLHHKH